MSYFKSMLLAGAVAFSGVFSATNADALFLTGTFEITAYNYQPTGNNSQRQANSRATAANFTAISSGGPATSIGTRIGFDTFTYSGALRFRVGNSFSGPLGVTTIAEFLGTGGGILDGLDTAFGNLMNSAGGGVNGDGGISRVFDTATLYRITARGLGNIDSLSLLTFVRHDDGITLQARNRTITNIGPNSELRTNTVGLTGGAGDFVLYYASANGDPSVLEVNAIPLPAAAWLLLGVAGALVAAKRRSTLRSA